MESSDRGFWVVCYSHHPTMEPRSRSARLTGRWTLAFVQLGLRSQMLFFRPLSVLSYDPRSHPNAVGLTPTTRAKQVLPPWGQALRSYGALLVQVYYFVVRMSSSAVYDGRLSIPTHDCGGLSPQIGNRYSSAHGVRPSLLTRHLAVWLAHLRANCLPCN